VPDREELPFSYTYISTHIHTYNQVEAVPDREELPFSEEISATPADEVVLGDIQPFHRSASAGTANDEDMAREGVCTCMYVCYMYVCIWS
jgi:hypothetical protein